MKAKYFEAGENGSRLGHQESSNMYLDSIKVKMALLEQMWLVKIKKQLVLRN